APASHADRHSAHRGRVARGGARHGSRRDRASDALLRRPERGEDLGMKVLVFGGAGFLGSYVVDALVARGHAVTVYDRRPSPHLPPEAREIEGDILDAERVAAAVRGAEVVYNFAGAANLDLSLRDPRTFLELNILGNVNVLEGCRRHPVRRFVYASSAYVLSSKGAFYGTSKRCSE